MAKLTLVEAMTKTAELVYKKVKTLLGDKVDKIEGKGLSTNDYTAADKAKLDKIEDGANKTIVDSEGSYSSENPLQNKVIWSAITTIGTNITNIEQSYLQKNLKGQANGVAELDGSGKVPSTQLPGFVDDVVDSYIVSGSIALSAGWLSLTSSGGAFTPEEGKIYNVVSSGEYQNQSYRWSGTAYVRLNEGVALGETQYTAYRGDRGKTAYERSETFDKVYKGSDTTHMLVTQEEKTKWNGKQDKITIDESLSGSSSNPVQNKAIYNALQIDETTLTSAINQILTD